MTSLEKQLSDVDAIMSARIDSDGPGAAVGVLHHGNRHFRFYGKASIEHSVPVSAETVFHVASVTKQFTALAICLLHQQGKLRLDDDVRDHLPWLHDFGTTITLRHLLQHTSGLNDQWVLMRLAGRDLDDLLTHPQIINVIRAQRELAFQPGTDHRYCNTGYTLAAEVVHAVAGQRLPDFCRTHMFGPLGMANSLIVDSINKLVPNRAASYARPGNDWEAKPLAYGAYGATNLLTTIGDLMIWAAALLDPQSIPGSLVAMATEPGELNDGRRFRYGLGLIGSRVADRWAFGHTGGDAGFVSRLICIPQEQLAVAVLANAPQPIVALTDAIARSWLGTNDDQPARAARAIPDGLAGSYFHPAQHLLTLEAGQEGLTASRADGKREPVFIREDSIEIGEDQPACFNLERDARGAITALHTTVQPGFDAERLHFRKCDIWRPTQAELTAIAGTYRCAELDVTVQIDEVGGGLVATSLQWTEPAQLVPSVVATFDVVGSALGSIEFSSGKEDSSSVASFVSRSFRHNNVRFHRVPVAISGAH